MTPETKQIVVQAYRDIADALEADSPQAYPDFENDVSEIVDDPSTVWTNDELVLEWSISTYGKSYKEMREIADSVATGRDLNFTTSFIPDDTIRTIFIIEVLNQDGKKK